LSRPREQEGLDGSDASPGEQRCLLLLDPTPSCLALSRNSLDHMFRKHTSHATERKENFTSKCQLKLRFGKVLNRARCRFLSPLPPESVQLSLRLLQLQQQKPCHLPICLFLSQRPNAFLTLGYLS